MKNRSEQGNAGFLNPYSEMNDVSPELANFLKFLIDGNPVDEFTERLMEAEKQ